ncbi:MAG: hypothetical protein N3G21_07625 [Candidatus Hydrogenedentes bacterium]|nr:hypothetical protein [Candidatus Hydrogenedentota bacterium]
MGKSNQIKINQEKRLENIEKELYEAMNILDDINKKISEALKTEPQTQNDLTDQSNFLKHTDNQSQPPFQEK